MIKGNKETRSQSNKVLTFISLGLGILLLVLAAAALIGRQVKSPPKLVSPVTKLTDNQPAGPTKSLSHYITVSQGFLNQARILADKTTDQTPAEKEKILTKIESALTAINQGIQAFPQDDRGYGQRANIYQAITSFVSQAADHAVADLNQAISINPKNQAYHQQLGNLYQRASDFTRAATAYFNAHHLSPTDQQNLYHLAYCLEKSGQIDKAIRYYDQLLALLPTSDENFPQLQKQKAALEKLLTTSQFEHLSEPGMELIPQPAETNSPILGTEELPLEQAALTQSIIIASPEKTTTIDPIGDEVATNAKTGTGVLAAGEITVQVFNQHLTDETLIYVVPLSDAANKVLSVQAKKSGAQCPIETINCQPESGWFKVGIDKPIEKDIEFKWWLIN